jgi:GrpB-like predicted nucleotidyltransferase (UPF0157 family)
MRPLLNGDTLGGREVGPPLTYASPMDEQTSNAEIAAYTVGELKPHDGPIGLVDYDPAWSTLFQREAQRIRDALGDRIIQLEHVGSTSVPELAAKPQLDILLVVRDSAAEPTYLPSLEQYGYLLRIREPNWFQHRMLKGPDANINLHVFSTGCVEIDRKTACLLSVIGFERTLKTASSMTKLSGSLPRARGGMFRTTPTLRRRSFEIFLPAHWPSLRNRRADCCDSPHCRLTGECR